MVRNCIGHTETPFRKNTIVTERNETVQSEQNFVLRPIVGLTENLPKGDLERITLEAIKTHRRLRDAAEERWTQCQMAPSVDSFAATAGDARIAYVKAMIEMHAQQAVLSTLLDVLGYIPSVPSD